MAHKIKRYRIRLASGKIEYVEAKHMLDVNADLVEKLYYAYGYSNIRADKPSKITYRDSEGNPRAITIERA